MEEFLHIVDPTWPAKFRAQSAPLMKAASAPISTAHSNPAPDGNEQEEKMDRWIQWLRDARNWDDGVPSPTTAHSWLRVSGRVDFVTRTARSELNAQPADVRLLFLAHVAALQSRTLRAEDAAQERLRWQQIVVVQSSPLPLHCRLALTLCRAAEFRSVVPYPHFALRPLPTMCDLGSGRADDAMYRTRLFCRLLSTHGGDDDYERDVAGLATTLLESDWFSASSSPSSSSSLDGNAWARLAANVHGTIPETTPKHARAHQAWLQQTVLVPESVLRLLRRAADQAHKSRLPPGAAARRRQKQQDSEDAADVLHLVWAHTVFLLTEVKPLTKSRSWSSLQDRRRLAVKNLEGVRQELLEPVLRAAKMCYRDSARRTTLKETTVESVARARIVRNEIVEIGRALHVSSLMSLAQMQRCVRLFWLLLMQLPVLSRTSLWSRGK